MHDNERTQINLRRHPSETGRARRTVAGLCQDLDTEVVEVAQLLTTELVTNALKHGRGDIVLAISRQAGDLRVDVTDDGPGTPQIGSGGEDALGGRGLMVVEALATMWGVAPGLRPCGKTVWFSLPASRAASDDDAPLR
jgi:anti-sigma regulatory factor (Ser/Thr protein kinase)